MSMKKVMIISVSLIIGGTAWSQNLDPTVEVSREYETKLIEVHKPALEMTVPDTLHRFDLDFDYSVFENPYKGSYEFSPYVLQLNPTVAERFQNTFYLNAGAGYTLHPTLDLLWSPVLKGAFSVDVHASHKSYVGGYRAVGGNDSWKGYDLLSKAGVDFGYDWKKAGIDFGASYYGVADSDFRHKRQYNAVDAYAVLNSKISYQSHFAYRVALSYRYAQDDAVHAADASARKLNEQNVRLNADFGPTFVKAGKLMFDIDAEIASYDWPEARAVGQVSLAPHYVYSRGIFNLDAGVRLSALINSGKNQIVYPDVKMSLAVVPDALKIYLNVGGGDKLNTYSSLLDGNHHFSTDYGLAGPMSVIGATVERVSVSYGFIGRITHVFNYNLRGGYVNYMSAPLDVAFVSGSVCKAGLAYSSYQKMYASLDWGVGVQSLRIDGNLTYNHTWGIQNDMMLAPSVFEGSVAATYNWFKRVYAGVDCEFATARKSATGYEVPAYADLGVTAEYVMNRKLSFWLRGGNLLNMEIQRNVFFAEKGINFTAGICLNF